MIEWHEIDTVLLDMDGTLLDLHFDNHFWLEHVPKRYAEARGLPLQAAREELLARYGDIQGTLNWYCVDHWSRELGLDIALLKQEVDHLIAVHPHVTDFLDLLHAAGKRRILVTNAHQKSLQLKMQRTRLHDRLDHIVCAHDLGLPKEMPEFWDRLQQRHAFDPARTLFVDDSLAVLRSARDYGIAHLLAILLPDTRQPLRQVDEFPAVQTFDPLLPELAQLAQA
ncbi:MAG: GMP/IMP nucleotidase [Gammaproteobacteria bacterium]|nr:GMP/IMP nucleotidase [Gammaproteobacteria bacterium]